MNIRQVRALMSSDMKINVQGRFPLSDVQLAVDTYLANMSAGKVLLVRKMTGAFRRTKRIYNCNITYQD